MKDFTKFACVAFVEMTGDLIGSGLEEIVEERGKRRNWRETTETAEDD